MHLCTENPLKLSGQAFSSQPEILSQKTLYSLLLISLISSASILSGLTRLSCPALSSDENTLVFILIPQGPVGLICQSITEKRER